MKTNALLIVLSLCSSVMASPIQNKIKIMDNDGYHEVSLDLVESAEINIKEMATADDGYTYLDLTRYFSGSKKVTTLLQSIDLNYPQEISGPVGCMATGGLTLHFKSEANLTVKNRSFSFLSCTLVGDNLFPHVVYKAQTLNEKWLRQK